MKANQAHYPVRVMCRLLGISTSGFYAWCDRPLSTRAREDPRLTALIHGIHRRSRDAYGAPSIHAELKDDHDIHVGCKRVARLMRAAGMTGVTPAAFVKTTTADPVADRALDRVDRQFQATGPDRLWVADITDIPTWAGLSSSRRGARRLVAPHRRLGDGDPSAGRTRGQRTRHGAGPTATPVGDSSFRQGLSIYELRLRQTLPADGRDAVDGLGR